MNNVTDDNKMIAKQLLQAFGGRPDVFRYWDEHKENSLDVLSCKDRPYEGVTAYSTIGLSGYELDPLPDGTQLHLEIAAVCDSRYTWFSNALLAMSFDVIQARYGFAPGLVFQNVLADYAEGVEMRHVLFVPAFFWEELRAPLALGGGKQVTWLYAMPISDREHAFAAQQGAGELGNLFQSHAINMFDLNRKSVV